MSQFKRSMYLPMFNNPLKNPFQPVVQPHLYQNFLGNIGDWTFTRNSAAWGLGPTAALIESPIDTPAYYWAEGVLLEGLRTNYYPDSFNPITRILSTVWQNSLSYVLSMRGTGSIIVTDDPSGVARGTATEATPLKFMPTLNASLDIKFEIVGEVTEVNLEGPEDGSSIEFASSAIETITGTPVAREPTTLGNTWPFTNEISGRIRIRPEVYSTGGSVVPTTILMIGNYTSGIGDYDGLVLRLNDRSVTISVEGNTWGRTLTSQAQFYGKGELLDIRFRTNPGGTAIWVNAQDKVEITDSKNIQFLTLPTTLVIGDDLGSQSKSGFFTCQDVEIWNESKSDEFLANL
jgi:hypothetical protein